MSQLVINGETTEADRILLAVRGDLLEKAGTLPPEKYREYLLRTAAGAVRDKIAEALLFQRGSLRLSEREEEYVAKMADDEIRRIVTTRYGGVQRRFEKQLETTGQTLEDARTAMQRQIVVARYLELNEKPKVPEPTRAELLALFEAYIDQWRRPPSRSMSLIDVRASKFYAEGVSSPTTEQIESARSDARSKSEEALTELKKGTPFAEVARKYSDGLHADEGGEWGRVTPEGVRDRFRPAVETLYKLEAGQVSDIVETFDSFFIVKCDEYDPGSEPDFQSVQLELRERLFEAAYDRRISDLVVELREQARIEPEDLNRFLLAVLETAPSPGDRGP